ncbi:hypothetical protein Tco_0486084, partial [Tanacetum coccineum]
STLREDDSATSCTSVQKGLINSSSSNCAFTAYTLVSSIEIFINIGLNNNSNSCSDDVSVNSA